MALASSRTSGRCASTDFGQEFSKAFNDAKKGRSLSSLSESSGWWLRKGLGLGKELELGKGLGLGCKG